MNTQTQVLRNRKGKQVYAGIGALLVAFLFAAYTKADNSLYVTLATAICALCGVGIWGNVKEHETQQPPSPPATPSPTL